MSEICSVAVIDNTITVQIGLPQARLQTHGGLEEPEAYSRQWQDHNSGNQGGFNTKGQ